MAGFSVLVALDSSHQTLEKDFQNLLRLTAGYKQLEVPMITARGKNCMAAKLDSPASIHHGIVTDEQTGSWLLAAGTVVSLEGDNDPHSVLTNLLEDYLARGAKALGAYDGQFALVIYNGRNESLSVVTDSISLFAIFYCQRGKQVLISTSALAIAEQVRSQPDILAVEHFLRVGRQDGDKTLWQDVRRLLGGMVLCVTHGHVEVTEYWSPTFDQSISKLPFEEALDQSVELLTNTFSRILEREGKVWVDLTGGFDTRLVTMLVAKANMPFTAYCMGPEDNPDVLLSRKISEKMNWEYVNTRLPEQWGPDLYSWFNYSLGCGDGRACVLRLAVTLRGFFERNLRIKTNLMGVGGENFRGFRWQIEGRDIGRTSKVNYDAWLNSIYSQSPNIPMNVMRYDRTKEVRQELYDFIINLCSKYSALPNTVQIDRFEFGRDSIFGGAYLSSNVSIGRSVVPFFFKAPTNFAFSLNYRWKYPRHHIFVRTLLERENKLLANLETTTGGPAVPIRWTNVHRFWPLWKYMTNRAVEIGSEKMFGKAINLWPHHPQPSYPLAVWRDAIRTYARSEAILNYDRMCSSGLYKRDEFNQYIERDAYDPHPNREFLEHIITVEMAFRATGTSVV